MIECLHDSIRHHAKRQPDHLAFKAIDGQLTYSELDQLTDRLAGTLISEGLKPGDRAGILLNRCIHSPVAVYGILKAGGVVVPMDPSAPANRHETMIKSTEMRYIISDGQQRFRIKKLDFSDLGVQALIGPNTETDSVHNISWNEVHQSPIPSSFPAIGPDDLAYIMFTSGSTGTPKGIMHTHFSGLSYSRLSRDLYSVRPEDVIGNHSPLHFDISTFGYFVSMLAGATTILCSDAHIAMPASLAKLIEEEKITIWYSVPLALIQMHDHIDLSNADWSKLRYVKFGGEPFPPSYIKGIMPHTPEATWCNIYGPAEVNQCTYHHFTSPDQVDGTIPLGRIWPETKGIILDEEDQPISTQEVGELVISSPTRMKGYWKAPDLTENAFYKSGGDVFYRTGDLVSRDEDGLLQFHGRKDRQVKIRGYRVELEEIEIAISKVDGIRLASAFPMESEAGEKVIWAAAEIYRDLSEDEVLRSIKNDLPGYARPSRLIFLEKIPRTGAGKIDFDKLRSLEIKTT